MPIKPSPLVYLYLLDAALATEIGIAFTITGVNRKYFTNTLRKTRKLADDPQYDEIIFFEPAPPHEHEIFICRKSVSLDDAQSSLP
jgi:hypothetical protein